MIWENVLAEKVLGRIVQLAPHEANAWYNRELLNNCYTCNIPLHLFKLHRLQYNQRILSRASLYCSFVSSCLFISSNKRIRTLLNSPLRISTITFMIKLSNIHTIYTKKKLKKRLPAKSLIDFLLISFIRSLLIY